MKSDTQSLLSLDVELEQRADILIESACQLPDLSLEEREQMRSHVLSFLRDEVGEHMHTDQHVLYPQIAERLGDPLAPAPMNYDHRAITWWTDEIQRADLTDANELQRLLYGIHALIKVHLSREEDLYLGAMDSFAWPAGR